MDPADAPSPQPWARPLSPVDAWRRYDADERRLTSHVTQRMLDLAGLRPGSRVLDIASGRGEPALPAAARVRPDGTVVATDVSNDMLEFARVRAAAESLTNLRFVVTDGEALTGVPLHACDTALCRWGFMFFERPREALRSVHRCLVRGGTLVSALWAEPTRVPWWSMPWGVLARHAPIPAADPDAPGPFRHASSAVFRADLVAAGFVVAHEEEIDTPLMEATTPGGLIDWCLAFGLARALSDQPERVRAAWHRDMTRDAERCRGDDGLYRLGGVTRLVVARAT